MSPNLRQDAAHGDPYACLALAYFYQTGKEMAQDINQSLEWYERAAKLGCARAHWECQGPLGAGADVWQRRVRGAGQRPLHEAPVRGRRPREA